MFRFFESIRLFNGQLELLDLHEERMARTQKKFFEAVKTQKLSDVIKLDEAYKKGLFKVKVLYGKTIEEVKIEVYTIKKVQRILLHEDNDIEYSYKHEDRTCLEQPLSKISDYNTDVVFIKNGFLTDASYANIALFNGESWCTPNTCLFEGVKRKRLIQKGTIIEKNIKLLDLHLYSKIAFINAMKDFEDIYSFTVKDNFLILKLME